MLCRNVKKAEETADEIKQDTGNQVLVKELDLASLESVRSCAAKLLDELDQIDMLINNAGKLNTALLMHWQMYLSCSTSSRFQLMFTGIKPTLES